MHGVNLERSAFNVVMKLEIACAKSGRGGTPYGDGLRHFCRLACRDTQHSGPMRAGLHGIQLRGVESRGGESEKRWKCVEGRAAELTGMAIFRSPTFGPRPGQG